MRAVVADLNWQALSTPQPEEPPSLRARLASRWRRPRAPLSVAAWWQWCELTLATEDAEVKTLGLPASDRLSSVLMIGLARLR